MLFVLRINVDLLLLKRGLTICRVIFIFVHLLFCSIRQQPDGGMGREGAGKNSRTFLVKTSHWCVWLNLAPPPRFLPVFFFLFLGNYSGNKRSTEMINSAAVRRLNDSRSSNPRGLLIQLFYGCTAEEPKAQRQMRKDHKEGVGAVSLATSISVPQLQKG